MRRQFIVMVACVVIILAFFVATTEVGRRNSTAHVDVEEILAQPQGCIPSDLSGDLDYSERIAKFEKREISIPRVAFETQAKTAVLGDQDGAERWIEVDLSDQKLYAWEGENLYLHTAVSTGTPWWPTPTGEFRVWIKLRSTKMEGGTGQSYYYLPAVPYVMFFENSEVPGHRGYGLHGAYWHNDFGTPRSHGCVNLPIDVARQLYEWVTPSLPSGRSVVHASSENIGTRIVIHR